MTRLASQILEGGGPVSLVGQFYPADFDDEDDEDDDDRKYVKCFTLAANRNLTHCH